MLSLSRNVNESIILETSDGPIEIIVSQVKGQQVRLAFDANKRVNIVRKELLQPVAKPFELY